MSYAPERVNGVEQLPPAAAIAHRIAVLAVTVLPLVALASAIVTLWPWGVSTLDLSIAAATYVVSTLGVTMGYHRLFAHRSFVAPPWLRYLLALAGSLAVQGAVISWVADHRRHHAHSDDEGDPHSPHVGPGGPIRRLWRAHVGWLWRNDKSSTDRWAPDLASDPMMQKFERRWPALALSSVFIPPLLGLMLGHSFRAAVTAMIWGTGVRLFVLHHMTWSINSVCHTFGRRAFRTHDQSRNVWPLAILSFGESWHNNHHAFPTSAVHGLRWWQIDLTALTIRLLAAVRIVHDVKRPTERQRRRRLTDDDGASLGGVD